MPRSRVRLLVLELLVLVCVVPASAVQAGVPASGYRWPVKPFDREHAVRSTFGDARTWFFGPPTRKALYTGAGTFSFHRGVDIVAPDGSAVYPVHSGVATLQGGRTVVVRSGPRLRAEYWHIVPSVRNGEQVSAYRTVLGHIRPNYGHVHFTEIEAGRVVNPLAPGRLSPYSDHGRPSIEMIQFRRPGTDVELLPELLRGRVELVAQARDRPDPRLRGLWAGFATAPALLTWHVELARSGRRVGPEHVAADFRTTIPPNRDFWRIYARGTRQNEPTFGRHRYWREEGVLLFRLGVLDTRRLPDGIYRLVVTASDIRGNAATARRTFLVWNTSGWPPVTPQG